MDLDSWPFELLHSNTLCNFFVVCPCVICVVCVIRTSLFASVRA
jgi:hypothetical protein